LDDEEIDEQIKNTCDYRKMIIKSISTMVFFALVFLVLTALALCVLYIVLSGLVPSILITLTLLIQFKYFSDYENKLKYDYFVYGCLIFLNLIPMLLAVTIFYNTFANTNIFVSRIPVTVYTYRR